MPRHNKSYFRRWQPKEVVDAKMEKLSNAFEKFGLVAEGGAKKELYKGHGVLTGTLRRSIHLAQPGYDWSADAAKTNMKGKARTKGVSFTLGGKAVRPNVQRYKLTLLLGSGLVYALRIHQLYKYISLGVKKARPQLPKILKQEFKK